MEKRIELQAVKQPNVFLSYMTPDPMRKLYLAYRSCYSAIDGYDLHVDALTVSPEKLKDFIERRMKTEHTSPLEQVGFQFIISDVSRTFTHQFVRHRVGVSIGQQSNRYVDPIETGVLKYIMPSTVTNPAAFRESLRSSLAFYQVLLFDKTPQEDARMILPSCQASSMVVTINFAAMLHMADIRLCHMAQAEFRKVVSLMRAAIIKESPELGSYINIKCQEGRQGFCDEDYKQSYCKCPLYGIRPHKEDILNDKSSERVRSLA